MGAHVRHIEISNFKSLRHVSLDGCRRINVFIGAPNSGKSAILEALSLLSYIQPDNIRPITDFCRMKFGGELFFEGNKVQPIGISVDDNLFAELYSSSGSSLELAIQFGPKTPQPLYAKKVSLAKGNPSVHTYLKEIPDAPPLIKKYIYSNNECESNIPEMSLNFPNGENLGDVMRFNPNLRGEVAKLLSHEGVKLTIDTENGAVKGLRILKDDSYYLISLHQMGDTLRRLVFYKSAIMSNRNSLLLFEEPEAHLYPPYIGVFTGDLVNTRELNNQYFISTHSELILNALLEEGRDDLSIYVASRKNNETEVKRLEDNELRQANLSGRELLFNIESYADQISF